MEKTVQGLKDIYMTLNEVTVKGDTNISYMFGSLSALKQIINDLEKEEEAKKQK